jgi:hypothetical protein
LLLLSGIGTAILPAETRVTDLQTFLRGRLALTPPELASLETGQTIAKLPRTPEARELAAFAITRTDIPADFLVGQVRDIVNFKTGENVLQIGKFSNPPLLADLAGLTLDDADIDAIRRCRLNSCDIKVPESFIDRFRKDVNWSAPNYRERATAVMRELMLERVNAYSRSGNAALGEYRDKSYRLNLADELRTLLEPAPYMYEYTLEFQKYLQDYPQARPADTEDFMYWSKEEFGLKPVISLTHVVIYKRRVANGTNVLIASKGIYASHYVESSLGLTGYIHRPQPEARGAYLIYINRTRADALRGFFGGLKRALIVRSLRDATHRNMGIIKKKLESEYWQ